MPLSPKCPRCNLAFGTKDPKCPQGPRMPLMLDCGHTFCSDCLARLAKQQRTAIVCHTCQHSTELSEECSLKTLWPDVYVHGLLAVNRSGFATQPQVMEFQKPSSSLFNKTQPKPNMCEECSAKVATCRCLKCEVILCGVCFEKIHRVSNVLRQHHAEPYNSKDSDVNYGKGVSPICTLHKRANEFYCTEEEVAFCAACAGLGCHKDHLVITVEDKEKSDLENLHTVLGQANNILQHSKKSSQLINSMVPACQSHGSRLIERLQEHFLQLHGTLQAREHCLIDELLKSFQKDIGSVVEMEATLVEQIRKIETIIGDARAVISGNKRHLKGCQVVEQLTEVLDVPCYATVAGGGNLQIQFKCEDEKLFREIQVHGQWDGRFVDNLKFDKLSDVSVMNERGEHVPLLLSSGRMSALENSVPLPFDMKNGGSDLDSISLNSDYEHPSNNHELENEPKFKPRESLLENPVAKSRFKVHSELVHVSHIYNPCNFYVNLSRDLSTLMMLSRNIHTHCSYTGKRDIPSQLEVGDQVLAQFGQDGQWYRAEVIEVNEATPVSPATLRVLYTDYGNKELTSMDRIRNIHPKFLQHPLMAKRCTLVDIVPANGDRWSNETISTFARITKDRPMIMTVIKEVADLWYVDLSRPASEEIEDDGPVSVRDALVFLDMASFISPHSMPPKIGGVKQRCYLRPSLPQFGESVRVTLTFVASPHDFYVQMLGSESRHLQELMVNMQKTYDEDRGDLYTMFCPAKGMLCVAKYAHDGMWYRAEVVELKGGCQVNIRYVDYGNIELMSVWKLKKLLDVYLVLPAQAVHCRLADVGPVEETGKWQPEATTFLTKLLNEPELTIKVKEVVNRSTLSVYLHSEMMLHSVNTSMISNGWALATGPGWEPLPKTPKSLFLMAKQQKAQENNELAKPSMVPVLQPSVSPRTNAASATVVNGEQEKPKCPKVTVSHVVSPGEFYVQDSEKIRSLQQLMTKLNEWIADEDKKSSSVNQWKMADMCAVCTEEDKRWYRGQIVNIEESTAEVFLLDFGYKYTVELSSLMALPESLKSVTRFTIRCHFADIVPAGDPSRWSQTSCDALKSLALNKTCYLVVKSIMDDSSSLPVDLLLEVFVKGGAVTPDKTLYNSVAESLRDKGLALKKRNSCTALSSPRVVASVINHITSDTVPGSNHAPTKSSEVAYPQQTKEEASPPQTKEVASSQQTKKVASSQQPNEVVSSEQLKEVVSSEKPKEVVSSEEPKEVVSSEQLKEVVSSEQLKEVLSSEQPKEVVSSEQPKEVVSSEQPKEVASSEQLKEVASSEQLKEVASSEQLKEVASSEQPKEVVSSEQLKEVVYYEQPKEVVSSEQPKEVVSSEQPKEVVSSEQPKEVASCEQPKEVASSEQPKEVASSERPKEVASSERPKEERPAPVQSPTIDALDGDYPPPDIPPTEKLVLGVTHVDKNGVIYGQEIKADLRYLQQLLDRVASHYKNSSPSIGRKWRQGELVVAQYTEDDGFYRGKILSLSGDFAEVYYVDYGNRETLSTERLRPAIFTDEPAQCYQCRLHDLSWNSCDGLPTDDACSALYQLLVGKVSTLQIKEKSKPGLPLVVDIITSEGKDLSQFLIDARFAVRQELRSVSPEDQRMSSTSEPSIHHPSPLKASQSFPSSKLTPNRTDSQTGKPGNQPSPGKSFKSGGDCPSQGFSSGVQETAVEASIESRQALSQSAVDSSGKAIPPAFPHPCGYGSWVGDTDASRPGAVLPRIPKRKVPSPYPRPTEPKVGEMMIMTVTQVDAPDLVYLQCIKLENVAEDNVIEVNKQLDQLLELSKWYGANYASCPVFTANQLTPGRPCIAQYSVDNCWYRAEIIDVRLSREESLEVDVLFIDYGSSDCLTRLENLRIIPNVDVSLPAQAMFCHLDGILPRKDWSTEDVHRVEDVVKHKVLITSVKNIQNGEIFVDLFEQEVYTREGVIAPLVYQPLVDDGILMFSPAHVTTTSLANEDSSESIHSESDTVTVKNPSKSNVEGEELLDDPGSDV